MRHKLDANYVTVPSEEDEGSTTSSPPAALARNYDCPRRLGQS
jgi:hypothetical protein